MQIVTVYITFDGGTYSNFVKLSIPPTGRPIRCPSSHRISTGDHRHVRRRAPLHSAFRLLVQSLSALRHLLVKLCHFISLFMGPHPHVFSHGHSGALPFGQGLAAAALSNPNTHPLFVLLCPSNPVIRPAAEHFA